MVIGQAMRYESGQVEEYESIGNLNDAAKHILRLEALKIQWDKAKLKSPDEIKLESWRFLDT